jgi:hypothetical protein
MSDLQPSIDTSFKPFDILKEDIIFNIYQIVLKNFIEYDVAVEI